MKHLLTNEEVKALELLLTKARDKYTNSGSYLKVDTSKLPIAIQTLRPIARNLSGMTLEVTDPIYDGLEDILRSVKPESLLLKKVGAPVSRDRTKVKLPFFMGSLSKIMPESTDKWLMKNAGPYVVSDKLDGASLAIKSENGIIRAYTRGEGDFGQEVTDFIVPNLPKNLPKNFEARAEAIISPSTFKQKWKTGVTEDKGFKNPRNMVAGILNRKTAHNALKDVDIVFHELIYPRMKHSDGLEWLKKYKLKVVSYKVLDSLTSTQLSSFLRIRRQKSPYEIDGLVVTLDKKNAVNFSAAPNWAVAFKENLLEDTAVTQVTEVVWEVSKRNRVIPRVFINPVEMRGITVSKATGFNAKYIVDNKIGPGAVIRIQRSKDVIPDIVEVLKPAKSAQLPRGIQYKWDDNKTHFLIEGEHDLSEIKRIAHFFTVLGVEGFKVATASKLYDYGFDSIGSIIRATKEDLLEIEGIQDRSASKLITGIQKAIKNVPVDKLMEASSIFGLNYGERRLNQVVKAFPNLDFTLSDLLNLPGFQVKTAKPLVDNMPKFKKWLKAHPEITWTKPKQVRKESNLLAGKNVIFTGFRNKELETFILKNGGSLDSGIKATTIVLAKDPTGDSLKLQKARDKGAAVMSETQFRKKYGA